MQNLLKIHNSVSNIETKRNRIAHRLISLSPTINSKNIKVMIVEDLEILFKLYDMYFFDNWFNSNFKGEMDFSISKKMTRNAGKLLYPNNYKNLKPEQMKFEIRMSTDFFYLYGAIEEDKIVSGIKTDNSLQAYQLVFEHELCHLIEMISFNKSSCKGDQFKSIARNIFGHTESTHGLPTYKDIADHNYGIKVGDPVSFHYKNGKLQGIVSRITKRATVMVEDENGNYRDKSNTFYSKYYIPIDDLIKEV